MALFKKQTEAYYDIEPEIEETELDYEEENAKASAPSFGGLNIGGNNIELKVVRPEKFSDAPLVADHLLSNRTVVLNLENTDKDTSRHLIDFLSGVTYALDGDIKKVANDTFIITPHNVSISDAQVASEEAPEEPQPVGFTSDEDDE
ncbi:MAG: cell division protein SepF [Clostridia bacterium]|jgi:cell division inhibitor SepF|nr:cell division protein SepF [Clostridia bacterium]MBQ5800659.1 cell division protein SepF [Clostridia bacterium]